MFEIGIWASIPLVLLCFVSYLIRSPRFIPSQSAFCTLPSTPFYTWSSFYSRSAVGLLYLALILYPIHSSGPMSYFILTDFVSKLSIFVPILPNNFGKTTRQILVQAINMNMHRENCIDGLRTRNRNSGIMRENSSLMNIELKMIKSHPNWEPMS